MLKIIISTSLIIFIAGCSTISEERCIEGSWEELGYENGLNGVSQTRFHKISDTCEKYGIIANTTQYFIGYDQGLPLYCTYDRGTDHGEAGRSLNTECRDINAVAYIDGYAEGRIIYEIQREYELLIDAFKETRKDILSINRKLEKEDLTDTDRARLRKDRRIYMEELNEKLIDVRVYERLQGWPKRDLNIPLNVPRKN